MYFSSAEDEQQIDQIVADHLVRINVDPEAVGEFVKEAGIGYPKETEEAYEEMHSITRSIEEGDLWPALSCVFHDVVKGIVLILCCSWVDANQIALEGMESPLAFALHRSHFMHCLLTSPLPPTLSAFSAAATPAQAALSYARQHLQPFYLTHYRELSRLLAATLYLPLAKLEKSPYADILSTPVHSTHLIPLFQSTFARLSSLPLSPPLKTLTDIGGSGALSKLAKVRSVMQEKKPTWSSTTGELPIEINLPYLDYRFHSSFVCPVSKEGTNEGNWPVRLVCGHVLAKESMGKLSKGGL